MPTLQNLRALGQSVWLDFIDRDLIASGALDQLIDQGLLGITSNPRIFEQAISQGRAYDAQLHELAAQGVQALEAYEAIAVADIRAAADRLRPVFDSTGGVDGFVSLEVDPRLAHETGKTVEEVLRLRARVDLPNVMYKIPATSHGVVATERLIGLGVNINITLMFSLSHYNAVAQAYLNGLEAYRAKGGDVSQVASVASFFISRVDYKLAPLLERAGSHHLNGKIGIANAKQVYKRFREIFSGPRWESLAASGARVQRPLWASTSTKDPALPDTLYVDSLIGPDTVNTMPLATLDAFLDHGHPERTIDQNLAEADDAIVRLVQHGFNLQAVGEELQSEGVVKFVQPFEALLHAIDEHLHPIE
ncbi:MAG: transaldolase [Chloroflexi bacterium]|nr:transaldolase [Chloroflexota bacterium]